MAAGLQRELRIANSAEPDTGAALAEVTAALGDPTDLDAVLFVAGPRVDCDVLQEHMIAHWPGRALGSVAAGYYGPNGYERDGLVVLGIESGAVRTAVVAFDDLREMPLHQFESARREVDHLLGCDRTDTVTGRLGLLLVDGGSCADQHIGAVVQRAFRRMPVLGGVFPSRAGVASSVFASNRFLECGGAMLVLQGLGLEQSTFVAHEVEPISEPLVVTASDADTRWLEELDGTPAVEALAGAIGISPTELRERIVEFSLLIETVDMPYSRALCRVGAGGIEVQAGIDVGVVVRLGRVLRGSCDPLSLPSDESGGADRTTIVFESVHRHRRRGAPRAANEASERPLHTFAVTTQAEIVGSQCLHHCLAGMHVELDAYDA